MENRTFKFASGVVEVTNEKISFRSGVKDLKQFQSMERYNMGHINSEQFSYLGTMPIQIALRSILLGIIVAVIAMIVNVEIFSVIGVVMIIFGLIVFNLDLWVDGLFGTKFGYQLCAYLLAGKGHKITIQNNSGGEHIVFYISLDQLSEARKLEGYKIKEKPIATPQLQPNGLDDLEKISELYKKGILTEEEFTQKKRQLLNL